MNWQEEFAEQDRELGKAIAHFKASMDAWSGAALSQPRRAAGAADSRRFWRSRQSWRCAAGWAMGAFLAAVLLAGGVWQRVHRSQMAGMARHKPMQPAAAEPGIAARQTAPLRSVQTGRSEPTGAATKEAAAASNDALLASVDRDLSRQIPAAMEPLAQLMNDSAQ